MKLIFNVNYPLAIGNNLLSIVSFAPLNGSNRFSRLQIA